MHRTAPPFVLPFWGLLLTLLSGFAAAEPLRIAKPELFSLTEEIATEIMREAYRRAQIPLKLVAMPVSRSLYEVAAGSLDGDMIRYAGVIERTDGLIAVPEPVLQVDFGVYTRQQALAVSDWPSLAAYRIGVIRGVEATRVPTEGMDRIFADTLPQLFELLERGRVDLVLAPLIEGQHLQQRHPNRFQAIRYNPPPLRGILPYYHTLNAKHQAAATRLAASLRAMTADGSRARIEAQLRAAYLGEGAN